MSTLLALSDSETSNSNEYGRKNDPTPCFKKRGKANFVYSQIAPKQMYSYTEPLLQDPKSPLGPAIRPHRQHGHLLLHS